MICRTYDFFAEEQKRQAQFDAEVDARTAEEIALNRARAKERVQMMMDYDELYWRHHKKVKNKEKTRNFIKTAINLRTFTRNHMGWIRISLDDAYIGMVEMRFVALFFMDMDALGSHATFANLFRQFQDIHIVVREDNVVVQIFAELYDVISTSETGAEQEPH